MAQHALWSPGALEAACSFRPLSPLPPAALLLRRSLKERSRSSSDAKENLRRELRLPPGAPLQNQDTPPRAQSLTPQKGEALSMAEANLPALRLRAKRD